MQFAPHYKLFTNRTHKSTTQHIAIFTYGGGLADQHSTSAEMPWKFNAKELDAETGLYYYGARYYEPGLAVWYGVDALCEEHADVSPFLYCYNNPVNYTDPLGTDTFKINTQGYLVCDPIKSKSDVFVVGGKEINLGKNAVKLTYLDKMVKSKSRDGSVVTGHADIYQMNSKASAKKLFIFMAESTSVEWSNVESANGGYYVSNSHNSSQEQGVDYVAWNLLNKGQTAVNRFIHSHPYINDNSLVPSQGDIDKRKFQVNKYPGWANTECSIYRPQTKDLVNYYSYNTYSSLYHKFVRHKAKGMPY